MYFAGGGRRPGRRRPRRYAAAMNPARPMVGAGPEVGAGRVIFRVPDPDAALQDVRLYQEVRRPRVGPAFTRAEGSTTWELEFPRPAVDRMEYQLALRYPGAGPVLLPDPANPRRAQGPFGEKSVVEFPGYRPPAWLVGILPARTGKDNESHRRRGRCAPATSPDDLGAMLRR